MRTPSGRPCGGTGTSFVQYLQFFFGGSTTRELRDIGCMGTSRVDDIGTITTTADRCFRALLTTTKGLAKFNLSVCTGLYQPETPRATCWIAKEPPPQRYLQCSPLSAQPNLRLVARLNRRQAAPRVLGSVDGWHNLDAHPF